MFVCCVFRLDWFDGDFLDLFRLLAGSQRLRQPEALQQLLHPALSQMSPIHRLTRQQCVGTTLDVNHVENLNKWLLAHLTPPAGGATGCSILLLLLSLLFLTLFFFPLFFFELFNFASRSADL